MDFNDLYEFKIRRHGEVTDVPEELVTDNEYIQKVYNMISNLNLNTDYLKKNAQTLKFVEDESLRTSFKSSAFYDAEKNEISYSKRDYKNIITHELLHASTSVIEPGRDFLGFHQVDWFNNRQVGEALNEGYTATLDARYFGDVTPEKLKLEEAVYPIVKRVAQDLECTLGDKLMMEYYFNSDLKSFRNAFGKLMGIKHTDQFLYTMDALFEKTDKYQKLSPIAIHQLYPTIELFCAEAFYTKITDKYRHGTLSKDDYKMFLELVEAILGKTITILKVPITKDLREAKPLVEERYEKKYKIREKNNCLVK